MMAGVSYCVHEFLTVKVRVSVLTLVISFFNLAYAVIVKGEPVAIVERVDALTPNVNVLKAESPVGVIVMKLPNVEVTSTFAEFFTM
jgi:hypothetical protein